MTITNNFFNVVQHGTFETKHRLAHIFLGFLSPRNVVVDIYLHITGGPVSGEWSEKGRMRERG